MPSSLYSASARAFIEKLPADDEVGLFAYPRGIKIDPTTDHDAIVRALGKIVVQRDAPPEGEFQLTPAELVDLSTWTLGRPTPQASQLMDTLCHGDVTCLIRLDAEVTGGLMHDEAMAQMSAGTLSALIRELGKVPLRKTVVLVSGGFVTADVPGARPDNQEAGTQVGKTAAAADVSFTGRIMAPRSQSKFRYDPPAALAQARMLATHKNCAIGRAFPRRLGPPQSVPARMGCALWDLGLERPSIDRYHWNRCRNGCPQEKDYPEPPGHAPLARCA